LNTGQLHSSNIFLGDITLLTLWLQKKRNYCTKKVTDMKDLAILSDSFVDFSLNLLVVAFNSAFYPFGVSE